MAAKKNDNLTIYDSVREVPDYALKEIKAGRLKGMSDINPMFRIKKMTEIFGPCGIGWKYEITNQWFETFGNEVKAFTNINLYYKYEGEWSEAIPGTGGASFVAQEKSGPYVNDESMKMALTDALSVAMKALGVAADIYYAKDGKVLNTGDSKYQPLTRDTQPTPKPTPKDNPDLLQQAINEITSVTSRQELDKVWKSYPQFHKDKDFLLYGSTMGKKFPKQQDLGL